MSHLETPALPPLQVPWVRLSIPRALRFTPHLVLGALCPPWSHPHPPHPLQHCPLRPQSNTECGFLLFSFSLWRDLIPEQPTLSCVMPAPHSMVPPLLATTLPCTATKMFKRDQHMLMDRTGGGSRSEGGNCETLSLLGSTSLMSSGMDRKGEGTDEKMSPWALAV